MHASPLRTSVAQRIPPRLDAAARPRSADEAIRSDCVCCAAREGLSPKGSSAAIGRGGIFRRYRCKDTFSRTRCLVRSGFDVLSVVSLMNSESFARVSLSIGAPCLL
ncbi:hypothetical protein GLE_4211 [Lysobacter enzymogenes]|uniref:Uncharacterized protein n=1 Tax=Lysobacter enzymogenes TaxID=69 RepID=A0A0S2DLZ0_LYSEN|nr:hypothetical protein GLE_4211 [Lysobacter enzymogenes]